MVNGIKVEVKATLKQSIVVLLGVGRGVDNFITARHSSCWTVVHDKYLKYEWTCTVWYREIRQNYIFSFIGRVAFEIRLRH